MNEHAHAHRKTRRRPRHSLLYLLAVAVVTAVVALVVQNSLGTDYGREPAPVSTTANVAIDEGEQPVPTDTDEPDPAFEPAEQSIGRIAFARGPGLGCAVGGIWAVDEDGSNAQRLTDDGGIHPTWSSDGSKLAYSRDGDVWVMNADGSGKTQITDDEFTDVDPSWSPDGSRLAFASLRDLGYDIFVVDADGANLTRISDLVERSVPHYTDRYPAWSPDGSKIAYEKYKTIVVIEPDGSNATELVEGSQPAWSPDGSEIIFQMSDSSWAGLALVASDGVNHNITEILTPEGWPFPGASPEWLPDGLRFIYDDPDIGIAIAPLDGPGVRVVSDGCNPSFTSSHTESGSTSALAADAKLIVQLWSDFTAAWNSGPEEAAAFISDHNYPGMGYSRRECEAGIRRVYAPWGWRVDEESIARDDDYEAETGPLRSQQLSDRVYVMRFESLEREGELNPHPWHVPILDGTAYLIFDC